jgi:5'-methylthioadenosine/S-adenosylhomocysteine nucleosidase
VAHGNPRRTIDLAVYLAALYEAFPQLAQVYLFGSRVHRTGSARSDIDLLAVVRSPISLAAIGSFAYAADPYLDVFLVRGSSAVSSINGSYIAMDSFADLLANLDAELVWEDGHWVGDSSAQMQVALANYEPGITIASSGPMPRTIYVGPLTDYLVVTALKDEYDAVVSRLENVNPAERRQDVPPFSVGTITTARSSARRVAVTVLPRVGLVTAALTTRRLLDYIAPGLVALVGIAGGLESEVKLGDLVIPGEAYEYEAVKVTPRGDEASGLITPMSADHLSAIMQHDLAAWRQSMVGAMPDANSEPPTVRIGEAMASGHKVIAHSERAQALKLGHRKTISVEMEAFGVAEACRQGFRATPFIVIKGVSDYANEDKNDAWRAFCCAAAADLLVLLVRSDVI